MKKIGSTQLDRRRKEEQGYYKGKEVKGKMEKKKEYYYKGEEVKGEK